MVTLTPEQRQEILRAGEEPVRLADPETQTEYVILKADVYDRIRALADDSRAAYPLAMKNLGDMRGKRTFRQPREGEAPPEPVCDCNGLP